MSLRGYDCMIACICFAVCVLTAAYWQEQWWMIVVFGMGTILFLLFSYFDRERLLVSFAKDSDEKIAVINGICLLDEDNGVKENWALFGRTAVVIGRDVGENQVDINLSGVTYDSFIEIEHAVLNYAGDQWYIEDLYSKNGVMVQKVGSDRKYKLATARPCKLDVGDVVYIAKTKMCIQ